MGSLSVLNVDGRYVVFKRRNDMEEMEVSPARIRDIKTVAQIRINSIMSLVDVSIQMEFSVSNNEQLVRCETRHESVDGNHVLMCWVV